MLTALDVVQALILPAGSTWDDMVVRWTTIATCRAAVVRYSPLRLPTLQQGDDTELSANTGYPIVDIEKSKSSVRPLAPSEYEQLALRDREPADLLVRAGDVGTG